MRAGLSQHGCAFTIRGNLDTDAHTGECHVKMRAETGVVQLKTQPTPKVARRPPETGGDLEQIPPRSLEGTSPADTLIWDFWPPD